jgi:hypothetical protein
MDNVGFFEFSLTDLLGRPVRDSNTRVEVKRTKRFQNNSPIH